MPKKTNNVNLLKLWDAETARTIALNKSLDEKFPERIKKDEPSKQGEVVGNTNAKVVADKINTAPPVMDYSIPDWFNTLDNSVSMPVQAGLTRTGLEDILASPKVSNPLTATQTNVVKPQLNETQPGFLSSLASGLGETYSFGTDINPRIKESIIEQRKQKAVADEEKKNNLLQLLQEQENQKQAKPLTDFMNLADKVYNLNDESVRINKELPEIIVTPQGNSIGNRGSGVVTETKYRNGLPYAMTTYDNGLKQPSIIVKDRVKAKELEDAQKQDYLDNPDKYYGTSVPADWTDAKRANYQKDLVKLHESFFSRPVKNFTHGFLGIGTGTADFINMVTGSQGAKDFSDTLTKKMEETADADPNIIDSIFQGLGSQAAFGLIGKGVATIMGGSTKVAPYLLGKIGFTQKAITDIMPKLSNIAGAGSMAVMEAAVESGNVKRQGEDIKAKIIKYTKDGLTDEAIAKETGLKNANQVKDYRDGDVDSRAWGTFFANVGWNYILDKAAYFSDKLPETTGLNMLKKAGEEGVQEMGQEVISEGNLGQNLDTKNIVESGVIGAVTAGPTGAVTERNQFSPEYLEDVKGKVVELQQLQNNISLERKRNINDLRTLISQNAPIEVKNMVKNNIIELNNNYWVVQQNIDNYAEQIKDDPIDELKPFRQIFEENKADKRQSEIIEPTANQTTVNQDDTVKEISNLVNQGVPLEEISKEVGVNIVEVEKIAKDLTVADTTTPIVDKVEEIEPISKPNLKEDDLQGYEKQLADKLNEIAPVDEVKNSESQGNAQQVDEVLKDYPDLQIEGREETHKLKSLVHDGIKEIPGAVAEKIGIEQKKLLLKDNIIEKNKNNHPELLTADNETILNETLTNPTTVIQGKPIEKPNYYTFIKENGKDKVAVVDVDNNKGENEIVGWRYSNKKYLERLKEKVTQEGGQVLILNPNGEATVVLSDRLGNSQAKDTKENTESQEVKNQEEIKAKVQGFIQAVGTAPKGRVLSPKQIEALAKKYKINKKIAEQLYVDYQSEQTKDKPESIIGGTTRHLLPEYISKAIENEAHEMLGELEQAQHKALPPNVIIDNVGNGWEAISASKGAIINSFPDWFRKIKGGTKASITQALEKIIEDNGSDKGLLVERVKGQILEHLKTGKEIIGKHYSNNKTIDGKKTIHKQVLAEIPADENVQLFLDYVGEQKLTVGELQDKFNEYFKDNMPEFREEHKQLPVDEVIDPQTQAVYDIFDDNVKVDDVPKGNESDTDFNFGANENNSNNKFNDELGKLSKGELPNTHIFQFGRPNDLLKKAGLPDLPIELKANRLLEKTKSDKHPLPLEEIKDLPNAIQKPIAVFAYGNADKAMNVITEIEYNGKNILVGLHINQINGKKIEVNDIRNVFPKDNPEWLHWIEQDKATYLNKEKLLNLISRQRINHAEATYLDLGAVSNIINNFDNAKGKNNIQIENSVNAKVTDTDIQYLKNKTEKIHKAEQKAQSEESKLNKLKERNRYIKSVFEEIPNKDEKNKLKFELRENLKEIGKLQQSVSSRNNAIFEQENDETHLFSKDKSADELVKELQVKPKRSNNLIIETYNKLTKYKEDFAKRFDDFLAGKLKSNETLTVTETPDVLVKLGAKQLPITISQDVLRKDMFGKHSLTEKAIKKLTEALHEPIFVFNSATEKNSLVVVTDIEHNNRSVMVAVHLNYSDKWHQVNKIASAYERSNENSYLTWIDEGRLRYIDNKKSSDWLRIRGLQLPKMNTKQNQTFNSNILTEKDIVKPFSEYVELADNKNNSYITVNERDLFGYEKENSNLPDRRGADNNGISSKRSASPLRKLKKGDEISVERHWNEYKNFNFFLPKIKTKIETFEDAAFVLKQLSDQSIEHAFIVANDKNNKPLVIHLGSGSFDSAILNKKVIHPAIKDFGIKEFYLAHNHPTGSLELSPQDKKISEIFSQIAELNGVKLLGHILVDSYNNNYNYFTLNSSGWIIDETYATNFLSDKAYTKVKSGVFSKLVFHTRPLSDPINTPETAASLIANRLSDKGQTQLIVLDTGNCIVGKFFLTDNLENLNYENIKEVSNDIINKVIAYGGRGFLLANNINGKSTELKDHIKNIQPILNTIKAKAELVEIPFLDYLVIDKDQYITKGDFNTYISATNLGVLEPTVEYKKNKELLQNTSSKITNTDSKELDKAIEKTSQMVYSEFIKLGLPIDKNGAFDIVNNIIKLDPVKATVDTVFHETGHAGLKLIPEIKAKALLLLQRDSQGNRLWDGKGNLWDIKSNDSLRASHEQIADRFMEYAKDEAEFENKYSGKHWYSFATKAFRLLKQNLNLAIEKVKNIIGKDNDYIQKKYNVDLYGGKLKEENLQTVKGEGEFNQNNANILYQTNTEPKKDDLQSKVNDIVMNYNKGKITKDYYDKSLADLELGSDTQKQIMVDYAENKIKQEEIRVQQKKDASEPTLFKDEFTDNGDSFEFNLKQQGAEKLISTAKRKLQDELEVLERLEKQGKTTQNTKFYDKMWLLTPKVAGKIDELNEYISDPKKGLIHRMDKQGIDIDVFGDYLYALHASERNEAMGVDGLSGLTNKTADELINKIEKDYPGIKQFETEFRENTIIPMLDTYVQSGLIGKEEYSNYQTQYKKYVPLKNFKEETEQAPTNKHFVGNGYSVTSAGIIRAKGRKSEAFNPFVQVISDYADLVVRAEKNKIMQAFTGFVLQNNDSKLFKINRAQYIPVYDKEGEIVRMQKIKAADNQVSVFVAGKQYLITIKDNDVLTAIKRLGGEESLRIWKYLVKFNNYQRQINTMLSPEFTVNNFIRDLQTAGYNLTAQQQKGLTRKVYSSIPEAMKSIYKKDALYKEFVEAGGKIGFYNFKDIRDIKEDLINSVKNNKRFTYRSSKMLGNFIESSNEIIENATRLATYKSAIELGLSKDQAATIAKNVTVDFNKRGEWTPVINSLYLFSNAGIQGTYMASRFFARSKQARRICYGIGMLGFLIPMLFNLFDDDDKYDEIPTYIRDSYYCIPTGRDAMGNVSYVKIRVGHFINMFHVFGVASYDIMKGNDTPWGAFCRVVKSVTDTFNPIGALNGTLSSLTPTAVRPLFELGGNNDFTGKPIYKANNKFSKFEKPSSSDYYSNTNKISVKVAKGLNKMSGGDDVTSGLIDIHPEALDYLVGITTGGIGKFANNTVNLVANQFTGKKQDISKTPFLRTVMGKTNEISNLDKQINAKIDKAQDDYYRIREYAKQGHSDIATKKLNDDPALKKEYNWYDQNRTALGQYKKARIELYKQASESKTDEEKAKYNKSVYEIAKIISNAYKNKTELEINATVEQVIQDMKDERKEVDTNLDDFNEEYGNPEKKKKTDKSSNYSF